MTNPSMNCTHCKKPIRELAGPVYYYLISIGLRYIHLDTGFIYSDDGLHYAEPCGHTSDWWKNFERCACCGAEYNEAEMLRIAEPEDR